MRKVDASDKLYYRSKQRMFCVNGEWFYQTREGNRGPFASRVDAERDAGQYQHEMSDITTAKPPNPAERPFGHAVIEPSLPPDQND